MSHYLEALTPQNSQIVSIDRQPQMAFDVQSIDRQTPKNNIAGLTRVTKVFDVPVTITTVEIDSFSGPTYPELPAVFPEQKILGRTSINPWDGRNVCDSLATTGRKKIVVAGSWTEVCNTTLTFCAMSEGGYRTCMAAGASDGTSSDTHKHAMDRMAQTGVVSVTWQQVLLEWQRDWARRGTYDATTVITKEHPGAYGMSTDYACIMMHKVPGRVTHGERIGPNPAK